MAGRDLKVQHSPTLRERNFGTLEGKTVAEVRTTLGPGYLKAAESSAGGKTQAGGDLANWTGVPGIETNEEVWVRASVFLREISHEHRGQDVLVVTHGGVLARAVYSVLGIPESMPRHFALTNGLVVILQLKHEIFHLLSLVDYPLAMNGVTTHDTATVKMAD